MSESILIKGGTIVTMDERSSIVQGDVLIRDGRIEKIGSRVEADVVNETIEMIEAAGCAVLPGFVQTHIHLCQTLFRGAADDLSLIDWLKKRVWPMEAAHTAGVNSRLGAIKYRGVGKGRHDLRADDGNRPAHRRSSARR